MMSHVSHINKDSSLRNIYKAVGSNLIVVRPKKEMHQSIRNLPVWWRKQLASVQSTLSMRSMLLLGGSGGMPPRKILKNRCSEIASESIFVKIEIK